MTVASFPVFSAERPGTGTAVQVPLDSVAMNPCRPPAIVYVPTALQFVAVAHDTKLTLESMRGTAPGATAATKQLLRRMHAPWPDLRDEAALAFATALRSSEAASGLQAFMHKHPAPWVQSGSR